MLSAIDFAANTRRDDSAVFVRLKIAFRMSLIEPCVCGSAGGHDRRFWCRLLGGSFLRIVSVVE